MDDVELFVFERVTLATREFDMVMVRKDYSEHPTQITMIPSSKMIDLKSWLGDLKMVWYTLSMNMQWKAVMQEVTGDLKKFIDFGGWQHWFDDGGSEDDAAQDSEESDFEADDSEVDEDDNDGDDLDEEFSEDEDDDDSDDDDDDDDDSAFDEEEEGKDWDELEAEAEEEERKKRRGGAGQQKPKTAPKPKARNTKRR
ncbi:FACT complex subunit SPT16 (Cell division control protein 68) (Facilitates chromatin transcription complex subunit SPT16) (Suppressor of Ty protein 16) [Durusdinium trenchii]|uniref:FACT complex subunit n=2 Tax=Durusdinium trenchii TaxID=1381693 RepID=A0ABP0NPQ5_9DINO